MEDFCSHHVLEQSHVNWSLLPESTQEFLTLLDLPSLHPFCNESSQSLLFPSAPDMGPPTEPFDMTVMDTLTTAFYYYIPPAVALFLVWFFFLVGFLAPLGTLASIWISSTQRERRSVLDQHPILGVIALISSWVIMTDDQYVMEFGRTYGAALLFTSLLALRPRRKHVPLLLSVLLLSYGMSPWAPEDPEAIAPQVEPGVYYNTKRPFIADVVERWKTNVPDYSEIATPWQLTGDARTGMPYTLNCVPTKPVFHRVWMPTVDDEYVALDISFPFDGGHNFDQPLYLVLHGLNGGSAEGYVVDFCHERNKEGSTCVVLIARGLTDTPIQGWTMYNGVRTSDVHSAASLLRHRVLQNDQTLGAVGYSLGAIVLNNYVALYGQRVALDVSVSISGALDCNYQQHFARSQRIWQSMIVAHMKDTFLYSKWGDRIMKQLGPKHFQGLMRAQDVVEADLYTGVMYNGYKDHEEFYSDMSALVASNNGGNQRGYFAIPHLVLQAFDDPISTWRTNAANDPSSLLLPTNLVAQEETSNLVLMLTKQGGHLGWATGWMPHSWDYMNNVVAAGFISSYIESTKASREEPPHPLGNQESSNPVSDPHSRPACMTNTCLQAPGAVSIGGRALEHQRQCH